MSDRPRFYLTTAIAYANNAPGLHTVYEVIGADVIARWHRMRGDETRFLTGTDEHSVNIAQTAEAQGVTPRAFVDEKVALFRTAEDAGIAAGVFNSLRQVGSALGVAIPAAAFDYVLAPGATDLMPGSHAAFVSRVVVFALALVAVLFLLRRPLAAAVPGPAPAPVAAD